MIRTPFRLAVMAGLVALAACAPRTALLGTSEVRKFRDDIPGTADPDSCWGKEVTPAVIQTVTRKVQIAPAQKAPDGTELAPATYRTEESQKIIREREETWFETVCDDQLSAEFVASLQRALTVQGYYVWAITGQMDRRTRTAIREFQKSSGLDSDRLSVAAARQLGLVIAPTPGRSGGTGPSPQTLPAQSG